MGKADEVMRVGRATEMDITMIGYVDFFDARTRD